MSLRTLVVICASLAIGFPVGAQAVATNQTKSQVLPKRISVSFDNTPLSEAIWTVARRSGLRLIMNKRVVPEKLVSYRAENVSPDAALAAVLAGTGLRATRSKDGMLELVSDASKSHDASGAISGKVTDAKTGQGISGVTISVAVNREVRSSDDGSYRITGIVSGTHAVTVRMVGYAKQSRSVVVSDGATITVDFKLEPSANMLGQIIVTGTVVQTELKAVPNAITVVTAKTD